MPDDTASNTGFAAFIENHKKWGAPIIGVIVFIFGMPKVFDAAKGNITWSVLSVAGVIWFFLFWVYTSKAERHVSREGQLPKKEKSTQFPKARKWALAGMIALPILTISGFAIAEYIERSPTNKVIILIADFDGPDPINDRVTQNIYDELKKATKEYPDLQVQLLGEPIKLKEGSDFARSKGEKEKASIVLWGSYGKTAENVQISVNFEVLPTPFYFSSKQHSISSTSCGDEAIHKTLTSPIQELNKFTLQANLSRQLSALTLMTIGVALYKSGNYDVSIDRFTKALKQWGNSGDVIQADEIYFWRADAYLAKGELDSAISDFGIAIQLKSSNASAYNNRGNAYYRKGDYDKAIADYNEAVKLGSSGCLACAYTNRGHMHEHRGDYDKAIADYTHAIQLKPSFADAYDGRGHAYTHKNDYEKAIADHNQAITLDPKNACFLNNRGHAYAYKKDYDKAIDNYNQAIMLEPNAPRFFNNRGKAYAYKKEYDKAIADYTQAIKLDPGFADTFHNRGHAYLEKGDTDKALDDFSQAIKLNPNNSELYWHRAQIYDDKDDLGGALADYDKAVQLSPDDAGYYHHRGKVYARRGDSDKAVADFTNSIQLMPNHPLAYFDRGEVFAYKKEYDKAIADYWKCYQIAETSDVRKLAQDALQRLGVATERGTRTK